MSQELYYVPPSDEVFNDLKSASITLWKTYDDTYGYATQKVDRIKDLENVSDNFMYMFAMFDGNNQQKVMDLVSAETAKAILERMQ